MADSIALERAWYVANTYSGQEKTVKENIDRRITSFNLQDCISRVIVAEQETDILNKEGLPSGRKKMKNLYPGYVFVEMIMTDEAWYMIRNTSGVTGFVGSSGGGTKPFPVPPEQIEPVLKRMGMVDDEMFSRYVVGDLVKVISGPLENTQGKIVYIDRETHVVRLETIFFGRVTPAEVDFSEIDKI
jgi:transcriptional antiterminator NusG